jgi:hypothetical protein
MNNVSTEAGRKAAVKKSRKHNELQNRNLEQTKRDLWDLWGKTNSQISRNCILDGIVSVSRELDILEKILA